MVILYFFLLFVFLKVFMLCKLIKVLIVNKCCKDEILEFIVLGVVNFCFSLVILIFVCMFFFNLFNNLVNWLFFFCCMIFVNLNILK